MGNCHHGANLSEEAEDDTKPNTRKRVQQDAAAAEHSKADTAAAEHSKEDAAAAQMDTNMLLPIFAILLTMLPSLRHRVIAAGTCGQWHAEARAFFLQQQQITFDPVQSGKELNVEALVACVGECTTHLDVHCFRTTAPLLLCIATNSPCLVTLQVSAECATSPQSGEQVPVAVGLLSLIRECCHLNDSSLTSLAEILTDEVGIGADRNQRCVAGWGTQQTTNPNFLRAGGCLPVWNLNDQLPTCYNVAAPLPVLLGGD